MNSKNKPWTKFQKITTILVFVVSGLSITGILLDEPIIINLELNKISDVDLKNTVFEINGILLNNFRDTVIFPDDKLTFKANLVNNHEDYVNYFVSLTLMQGGNSISSPIQLANRTLIPNGGWTSYQTEFFVGVEGTKELKINFVGKHPKTDEVIMQKTFSKDLQIQSLSDKIQSDQTNTLLAGVIASSFIGGGTLAALYFSNRTSHKEIKKLDKQNDLSAKQIDLLQKQNQDLKEQTSIQNRPWISIVNDIPVEFDGEFFIMKFQNYGKSVGHKIKVTVLVENKIIVEQDIITNGQTYPEFDVSPQEGFLQFIPVPKNLLSLVNTTSGVHVEVLEHEYYCYA